MITAYGICVRGLSNRRPMPRIRIDLVQGFLDIPDLVAFVEACTNAFGNARDRLCNVSRCELEIYHQCAITSSRV